MKMLGQLHRFLPLITFVLSGVVYFLTMAPDLSHTDSGELAGVLSTFGIAHPTGYPLFTLLGGLFMQLPLGGSPIWQANLFALLCVSSGIAVFTLSLREMLDRYPLKVKSQDPQRKADLERRIMVSQLIAVIAGALLLAFSLTLWQQSGSVEVYSLHFLLLCSSLYFLIRSWYEETDGKWWLVLMVSLALGFGNHLTTLLILPSVLLLFWWKKYSERPFLWFLGGVGATMALLVLGLKVMGLGTLPSLILAVAPGLAGLLWISTPKQRSLLLKMGGVLLGLIGLQYAWIWLRAGSDPAFNWGNPSDADAFLYHVSGKQFQVWMFGDMKVFEENIKRFLAALPAEFAYAGLALALLGLWQLSQLAKKWLYATLLAFIFTYLYVSNYGIYDLEPYFLLAYLMVGVWMVWGLRKLFLLSLKKPVQQYALWGMSLLLVGGEVGLHYTEADQSQLYSYSDYARKSLSALPPNSVVLTKQWNTLISQSWYLRLVEEMRPDVEVIGFTLMRDRFWYGDFLKKNHPQLAQKLQAEIDYFYPELRKFALEQPHNIAKLTGGFNSLIYGLMAMQDERPVFLSPEMLYGGLQEQGLGIPEGLTAIPQGYFYRLLPQDEGGIYADIAFPDWDIRFSDPLQANEKLILQNVITVGLDRASYEVVYEQKEKGRKYLQAILKLDPGVQLPPVLESLR